MASDNLLSDDLHWWTDGWMDGCHDNCNVHRCACVCVCIWWVYNIFTVMNVKYTYVRMLYTLYSKKDDKFQYFVVFVISLALIRSTVTSSAVVHWVVWVGSGRQVSAHSLRCDMHRNTHAHTHVDVNFVYDLWNKYILRFVLIFST